MAKTCQNGRFAMIVRPWMRGRTGNCTRLATHHASGFAGQDVDVCPLHAGALSRYPSWTITPLVNHDCADGPAARGGR